MATNLYNFNFLLIPLLSITAYSNGISQNCSTPSTPSVNNPNITCGQTATLTAGGSSGTYRWFNQASGGTPLSTGANYTTGALTSPTTFYVEAQTTGGGSGSYSHQTGTSTSFSTGGNITQNHTGAVTGATGNATLTVWYNGDLNSSSERIDIYGENNTFIGTTNTTSQCGGYTSQNFSISAANINNWASNGTITITYDSRSGVNAICSHSFRVYARLQYNYSTVTTCTSSRQSVTITPNPLPAPTISANAPLSFCSNDSIQLTSSAPNGNLWNTGDTTQSIYINQAGAYSVDFTLPNGCSSLSSTPTVTSLLPQPQAPSIQALTNTTVCAYDTVILQANQSQDLEWSNSDTSQTIQALSQGTYTAFVRDQNNCLSAPSNPIQVVINPVPNIQNLTLPAQCEGLANNLGTNIQLNNQNNASLQQVQWDFGDGNVGTGQSTSHNYQIPGTYNVQAIAVSNHGCSDTALGTAALNPKPIINSTLAPAVCDGNAVSFSNNSQVANTNNAVLQNYYWSFGDGAQDNATSTSHVYGQAGSYQAQLRVETNHGCSDTSQFTVLVQPNPIISNILSQAGCEGGSTPLQAQANVANINNASILTEIWNTGDGNTANGANTTHTYAQPGTYNAQLLVTTNHGCVDSAQVSAVVNPTPQLVQSSFPDVCLGQLSQFSQSTTLANVNNAQITGFAWDFGNGNQSNSLNPTQLYAQTGSYIVQLTVQTNQNCPMVVTDTVLVNPYPVIASINANDVCLGNPSNFSQSSSVPNTNGSNINQYLWSFGNGNTSTNPGPAYTYPNAGSYNAQLMVTTNFGCTDTLQTNVLVNPNPLLSNLSLSNVCMGNATSLNAGISIPNINGASIASQTWDMGDGTQLSGSNLNHNYLNPGLFVVQGTISSNQGCALQVTDTALVFPNPSASLASANTVCEETATSFNGNASISPVNGAAIASYQWNFGDGNTANTQNPSHNYATWGNYNYLMVVSSNHGCLDTLFGNATVHPKPVAQFDLPGHCGGSPMPLTDFSSIPAGSIDTYLWTSSDGLNSGQQNPVWTLAQGQQQVTLLLTSDQGCTDTLTKSIAVGQPFNTSFAPTLIGTATVQFLPDTLDPYLDYMWDFGDGTVSYQINPQHTYWNSGIYTVCLTISDSLCSSSYCTDMQLNATGVETLEAQLIEIKVGPNPFKDQLLIQLPEYNGNWSVSLRDAQGRLIGQKTSNQNQLLWSGLEHLSSGIYLVQVETEEGSRFVKVLK